MFVCLCIMILCLYFTMAERAQHAAQKTHANKKAPANQEKIFINLTAGAENVHYTKKIKKRTANSHNKELYLHCVSLFCLCCEHLQHMHCKIEEVVFLICRCFFYLQRVELSRPP